MPRNSQQTSAPDVGELRLLSISEFCERAGGLSPNTARKWIRLGSLRSVKVGGRRVIPVEELRRAYAGELDEA